MLSRDNYHLDAADVDASPPPSLRLRPAHPAIPRPIVRVKPAPICGIARLIGKAQIAAPVVEAVAVLVVYDLPRFRRQNEAMQLDSRPGALAARRRPQRISSVRADVSAPLEFRHSGEICLVYASNEPARQGEGRHFRAPIPSAPVPLLRSDGSRSRGCAPRAWR